MLCMYVQSDSIQFKHSQYTTELKRVYFVQFNAPVNFSRHFHPRIALYLQF